MKRVILGLLFELIFRFAKQGLPGIARSYYSHVNRTGRTLSISGEIDALCEVCNFLSQTFAEAPASGSTRVEPVLAVEPTSLPRKVAGYDSIGRPIVREEIPYGMPSLVKALDQFHKERRIGRESVNGSKGSNHG